MSFKNGDVLLFKNRIGDKVKVKYIGEDEEKNYSSCVILEILKDSDSDMFNYYLKSKELAGLRTEFLSRIAPASLENK